MGAVFHTTRCRRVQKHIQSWPSEISTEEGLLAVSHCKCQHFVASPVHAEGSFANCSMLPDWSAHGPCIDWRVVLTRHVLFTKRLHAHRMRIPFLRTPRALMHVI